MRIGKKKSKNLFKIKKKKIIHTKYNTYNNICHFNDFLLFIYPRVVKRNIDTYIINIILIVYVNR